MTREGSHNPEIEPVPLSQEAREAVRSAADQLRRSDNPEEQTMGAVLQAFLDNQNRPLTVRELSNRVSWPLADSVLRKYGGVPLLGIPKIRIKINDWLRNANIPVRLTQAIFRQRVRTRTYPEERLYVLQDEAA